MSRETFVLMLSAIQRRIWRVIVRAAPTCTLYIYEINMDALRFMFWPHHRVSSMEIMQHEP